MHFLCRSFIGRDPSAWSRFWENEPDDSSLRLAKGHLFSLITLSGSSNSDLASRGRALIDEITAVYLSSASADPKSAFNAVGQTLKSNYSDFQVNLVIVSLVKDQLYLFLFGQCSVYLYRGSSFSQIAHSLVGDPVFISGPAQPDDLLVFGSQSFFDQFGQENLLLPPPPSPSALEEFYQSRLIDFSNQSTAAALVKIIPDDESVVAPPPINQPPSSPQPPPPVPTTSIPRRFPFIRPKPVYVSTSSTFYHRSTRTVNFIIILLVIAAFGLLIGFGYRRNQQISTDRQIQALVGEIETKLDGALSVKNFDPDSALALTNQAKESLTRLKAITPDSVKVASLSKQIEQLAGQIGSAESFNPPLFYDTTLLAPNSKYQKMLLVGDQLALLDPGSGRVDLVHLELRSKTNYYQNSNLSEFTTFWVSASRILALSSSQISTLESSPKTLFSFSPPASYTAAASWNENSYLVGPSQTDIIKFTPQTKDNFSPPKPWLSSGKLDFSPVSIAINGKIYLLGSDCRVRLFDRGQPVAFDSVPIANCRSPSSLSVNLTGDKIAFIDNQTTVYLLDSKGQIKSRYVFSDKKFLDILLHPTLSKIYFLSSDQKIYYLEL